MMTREFNKMLYLRESTVVPDVAMMGEAVADITEFALLDVLLDRVKQLVLGDFQLGIGPTRHFNNHVQNTLFLVSKQRNVMEGRDNLALGIFYINNTLSVSLKSFP